MIYLRTYFEQIIKNFCNDKRLKVKYRHNPKEVQGNDFWEAVKMYKVKDQLFLDNALAAQIELYRSIVLNPISHAAITNVIRREIEDSIITIEKLETELKKPDPQ